jgi:hypothetical protein
MGEVTDNKIREYLDKYGFVQYTDEGRLLLAELLLKAGAGYYNSHTEEAFLKSFALLKKDRTPNKNGRRFLCSIFYNHSNRKPVAFGLMEKHRF